MLRDLHALLTPQERNAARSSKLYMIGVSPTSLSNDELLERLSPLISFVSQSTCGSRSFNDADLILINDTMTVCLQRANQLGKANKDVILTSADLSEVSEYICHHFGYAQGALANSLTMLLNKLGAYVRLYEDAEQQLTSWISQVLRLNLQMTKHHYNMAELLIYQLKNRNAIVALFPNLVTHCIDASVDRSLANAATKMLVLAFSGEYASPSDLYSLWSGPILRRLASSDASIILRYMVPALAKQCKPLTSYMLESFGQGSESHDYGMIMTLRKIGMDIGEWDPWAQFSELDWAEALTCFDPKIRLDAFVFLVGDAKSKSQSKPVSELVFNRIWQYHVIGSFASEEIEVRQLFILVLLSFIKGRHCVSMRAAQKAKKKSQDIVPPSPAQLSFLDDLAKYLSLYLEPGASYSQLITAVQVIEAIIEDLTDTNLGPLISGLASVVFGNYDDARQVAMRALLTIYNKQGQLVNGELFKPNSQFMKKAFTLLGDLGGRRSDSGASYVELLIRSCSSDQEGHDQAILLVNRLIEDIKKASTCGNENVYVHGHFKALSLSVPFVLSTFKLLQACSAFVPALIRSLFDAWDKNKAILSSAVFGGEDETFEQDARLTYAWKVVKESNALLLSLLNCPGAINKDVAVEIGNLIIEQISTVQHRGVFLSIYFSLIECAETCLKDPELAQFPHEWLEESVSLVGTKIQSISRRSAGLPYLISGLLIAFKKATKPETCLQAFAMTMLRLQQVARQPHRHISDETVDIAPVHAFNCIKQIISESTLNKESLLFSEDVLELALKNFSSDNWLVRNCAIMLFGVLHKRVFGDKSQAKYPMTLFFSRYPRFESTIMSYLKPCLDSNTVDASSNVDTSVLPPILLMLCELDSTGCKESETVQAFKKVLMKLMGNTSWHIREMIAKNLVNIMDASEFSHFASSVFEQASDSNTLINRIHTGLLMIKEIFKVDRNSGFDQIMLIGYERISKMPHAITDAFFQAEMVLDRTLDLHSLSLRGAHLVELLTADNKTLDGSKALCVETLSLLVLTQYARLADGENFQAVLELLLATPVFVTAQVQVLTHFVEHVKDIQGLKMNLSQALWHIISSNTSEAKFTKPKALQLFSHAFVHDGGISEECARKYCKILLSLPESELNCASSLKSIALCAKSFSDEHISRELLARCAKFAAPSYPLVYRTAAIEAIEEYMDSRRVGDEVLPEALLILFEKGLFDEDSVVRSISSRLLSKISDVPGHQNAHYAAHTFFRDFLHVYDAQKVAPLVASLFFSHAFSAKSDEINEETLFEIEKDNNYVNDVEVKMILDDGLNVCVNGCDARTQKEIMDAFLLF